MSLSKITNLDFIAVNADSSARSHSFSLRHIEATNFLAKWLCISPSNSICRWRYNSNRFNLLSFLNRIFNMTRTFSYHVISFDHIFFVGQSLYFLPWMFTLSIGCLISSIKIDGSSASRPNVKDAAVTKTLSCSTWARVEYINVLAISGI